MLHFNKMLTWDLEMWNCATGSPLLDPEPVSERESVQWSGRTFLWERALFLKLGWLMQWVFCVLWDLRSSSALGYKQPCWSRNYYHNIHESCIILPVPKQFPGSEYNEYDDDDDDIHKMNTFLTKRVSGKVFLQAILSQLSLIHHTPSVVNLLRDNKLN